MLPKKRLSNALVFNVLITILGVFCSLSISSTAFANNTLPDIGTSAATTLSVAQENEMGDFYIRQIRGSSPLINDPLLNQYVNQLGNQLARYADGGNQNFNFYLINNDDINAFAFFGGNVVLHSSLFRESSDENELASVVAHEIAHVTQRHLARAMEAQRKNAPLAWAGILGGALLSMANPTAGMAAVTGSLAGSQQSAISFTQDNEREADNIGVNIMARAGFDPKGMNNFMQKMADNSRYSSKPPQMLLTHPLPDSRLADARSRSYQFSSKSRPSSEDFWLAKARILAMYGNNNRANQIALEAIKKTNPEAYAYGNALKASKRNKHQDAKKILSPLLDQSPNNIWFIDAMTDIDLATGNSRQAIERLESALQQPNLKNNPVLEINLANAYVVAKDYKQAGNVLFGYTRNHPNDVNAWHLLSEVAAKLGNRSDELAARAENYALRGDMRGAIELLKQAAQQNRDGNQKAKQTARIAQLESLNKRFEQYR